MKAQTETTDPIRNPNSHRIVRALLPLSVFVLTFAAHYAWFAMSGTPLAATESNCKSCGISCSTPATGNSSYIGTQTYLLGYSIALSLAFASLAIRQFLEKRSKAAQGAALGGMSLSALLGFAGCYLTGCCGSPMLAVYVSLLGAAFLPFAKPLIAAVTTLSIAASVWWLSQSRAKETGAEPAAGCCDTGTQCEPTRVNIEKKIE